ncbi:MAG: hypothetical protein OQJ89_02045 [Kangiellaceae bacterium]|nr:hypothetical protein [Kangiellaceae bacterium]MCW8997919.1 hypothetical protein [Kangiellaceae bacterium]MCW9015726.1 hypothetical protein [Kangiellaceae bacterium]
MIIKKLLKDIKWSNLVLEIFSVIFAILLALWVNEYQQEKENLAKAQKHLARIQEEVKQNLKILEHHNPLNKEKLNDLQNLTARLSGKKLPNGADRLTVGYSFAPLANTEWEIAKLNGTIAHIDAEQITLLSQIYLAQHLYQEHWIEFTKRSSSGKVTITNPEATDEYLGSLKFSVITSDRLIDYYNNFLTSIKGRDKK